MKVTPDDPRLSAYLLGELAPEESLQIEHAAASDPAIRMSLDKLKKMTGFLDEVFGTSGSDGLMPTQRESIRRASRDADSLGKVVELKSAKRGSKTWIGGLAAAAAVAIAALLLSKMGIGGSASGGGYGSLSNEVALLPLPGPNADSGSASTAVASNRESGDEQRRNLEERPGEFLVEVSRHLVRESLPVATQLPATSDLTDFDRGPETRLPVLVGSASLRWVHAWIREKRQLPPRNAVRIEELVNSASLAGGEEHEGLRVVMESMSCPWDEGSTLAAVQIEATQGTVPDLKLVFHSNSERRVLGSFPVRDDRQMPVVLPAGRRTLVMIELRGSDGGGNKLEVRRGARVLSLDVPDRRREPSAGMRHAAALAGFGMWLRDDGVTAAELRKVLDSSGEDSDSVRTEVRKMMAEALELAAPER